jgi:hypothetical protein
MADTLYTIVNAAVLPGCGTCEHFDYVRLPHWQLNRVRSPSNLRNAPLRNVVGCKRWRDLYPFGAKMSAQSSSQDS